MTEQRRVFSWQNYCNYSIEEIQSLFKKMQKLLDEPETTTFFPIQKFPSNYFILRTASSEKVDIR